MYREHDDSNDHRVFLSIKKVFSKTFLYIEFWLKTGYIEVRVLSRGTSIYPVPTVMRFRFQRSKKQLTILVLNRWLQRIITTLCIEYMYILAAVCGNNCCFVDNNKLLEGQCLSYFNNNCLHFSTSKNKRKKMLEKSTTKSCYRG